MGIGEFYLLNFVVVIKWKITEEMPSSIPIEIDDKKTMAKKLLK